MRVHFENRLPPLDADPLTLLDGQRVVGGFKFYPRAQRVRTQMNVRLQVERVWVTRELVTEPPEVGRFFQAFGGFKEFSVPLEALGAEGYPNAVDKRVTPTVNRDFQAATDEEVRVVDDTGIRSESGQSTALGFRHVAILEGGVEPKIGQADVGFAARRAREREMVCHPPTLVTGNSRSTRNGPLKPWEP